MNSNRKLESLEDTHQGADHAAGPTNGQASEEEENVGSLPVVGPVVCTILCWSGCWRKTKLQVHVSGRRIKLGVSRTSNMVGKNHPFQILHRDGLDLGHRKSRVVCKHQSCFVIQIMQFRDPNFVHE